MLPPTSGTKRDLIMVPDLPPLKSPEDSNSQCVSFYTESENSSIVGNATQPNPQYFAPLYSVSKLPIDTSKLKYPNLLKMLGKYGEFPDKYRTLIWRYLLSLPLNKLAYENLLKMGVHPAYVDLNKKYPISSPRLFCRTQRLLSALAHWNPLLAEIDYMPGLVYPFCRVIEHDDLILFEIIVSLMFHWFQNWYTAFPQPPVTLLQMVEDCITKEDPELANFFIKMGFHPVQYAWPLLQTMFSEVLPKTGWLMVIDHVLTYSQHPQLLFALATSYVLQLRSSFMTIQDSAHLAAYVRTMSPIDVKKMIKRARELLPQMTGEKCPEPYKHNLPISKPNQPAYPVMGGYPKYVVELGSQIRRQIYEREQDILKQKQLVQDLQKKNQDLLEQEIRLKKQQEAALQAERERLAQKAAEQEVETLRQKSLANKEKAKRLKHISELESKIADSLSLEEKIKKLHEDNLAMSYNQKTAIRRQEIAEQQELEELKGLEYKATEKISDLMKLRHSEGDARVLSTKQEYEEAEAEARRRQAEEKWRSEDEANLIKRHEWLRQREIEFEKQQVERLKALREKEEEIQRKEKELEIEKLEKEREMRKSCEEAIYSGMPTSNKKDSRFYEEDVRASPIGDIKSSTYNDRLVSQQSLPSHMQSQNANELEIQPSEYNPMEYQKHIRSQNEITPSPHMEIHDTNQNLPVSEGRETLKMSVREQNTKESPAPTNTYSEPFTFKNTAAGISEATQDATRKVRASDTLFAKPPVQHYSPKNEEIYEFRKHEHYPTSHEIDMLHSKTRSIPPILETEDQDKLAERHTRVKKYFEEMQQKFGNMPEVTPQEISESAQSSVYSSSQNHSVTDEISQENGNHEASSCTSISGIFLAFAYKNNRIKS